MIKWFEINSDKAGFQVRTKSNGFELSILSDRFNFGFTIYWFGFTLWLPGLTIELSYFNRERYNKLLKFYSLPDEDWEAKLKE